MKTIFLFHYTIDAYLELRNLYAHYSLGTHIVQLSMKTLY